MDCVQEVLYTHKYRQLVHSLTIELNDAQKNTPLWFKSYLSNYYELFYFPFNVNEQLPEKPRLKLKQL